MRAGPSMALILTVLVSVCALACSRPAPTGGIDASVVAIVDAAPPPLACALPLDPEMMHDQIIRDECLNDFLGTCRRLCVHVCSTCGESCTTPECRAQCLKSRDQCARAQDGHCGSAYRECRTKLVTDWLTNKCDAVCAPFRKCPECDAGGAGAVCNPVRCDAMQSAGERKALDPKWKANQCDAVCAKIWSCAETECEKSGCVEPVKMYQGCALKTAGAKACALQDGASTLLCTEPEH